MPATQTSHPLEKFRDGCVTGHGAAARPIPLTGTNIKVTIRGGLASVATSRTFRNTEQESIEATITFPVPTDAVLTGLVAKIGDRMLRGISQAKQMARTTYEAALDDGKTAVMHEEVLRGIHIISVGHIPAGTEITVESRYVQALAFTDVDPPLRIPTTVGDVYGISGLNDADELIHAPVMFWADLEVTSEDGEVHLAGSGLLDGKARVSLDGPIDLTVSDYAPRELTGRSADGRTVRLTVDRAPTADAPINVELVADRSGSMNERATGINGAGETKFDVIRLGMVAAIQALRADDVVSIWQFNSDHAHLGRARGPAAASLVNAICPPSGSTQIGAVLQTIAATEARNVLLITDGKSHALNVQELARTGTRYTTVLIGEDALDAHLGYLASFTGGQIFVASNAASSSAITAALGSLRALHVVPAPLEKAPEHFELNRGGARIRITWETRTSHASVDDVGAFAAGLATALMPEDLARGWAEAHGLVTHLTSLVLVEEAAERQEGIPATRKVPLSTPRTAEFSLAPSGMSLWELPVPSQLQLRASRSFSMDAAAPLPDSDTRRASLLQRLLAPGTQESNSTTRKPRARNVTEALRQFRIPEGGPDAPRAGPQQDTPAHAPVALCKSAEVLRYIDWALDPKALSRGDTTAVHPRARVWILDASQNAAVQGHSREIGVPPVTLAIAIAALVESTRNRQAARVYRALVPEAFRRKVESLAQDLSLVPLP
jgi:hypothetical protein